MNAYQPKPGEYRCLVCGAWRGQHTDPDGTGIDLQCPVPDELNEYFRVTAVFTPAPLPPVGSRVKLTRDGRRWWDVRAADDRFAILTRQADFRPKGEVCYTILDAVEGIRGPCDLIGQSWHETMPDESCAELLTELQMSAKVDTWNVGDHTFDVEAIVGDRGHWVGISHRNRVRLDIGEIQPPEVFQDPKSVPR